MSRFAPQDDYLFRLDDRDAAHDLVDDMNDAHDYAVWQFQQQVTDLMVNHGYTESDLARLVIESLPVAEEVDFQLTIPADVPF